jgi:putative permease
MLEIFKKWYRRYLFEEESVLLLVLLTVAVVLLMTIGDILAPVLAAIVLAYLAEGLSAQLQNLGLPHWLGVAVAYLVFVGIFFGVSFALLPLVWHQLLSLASEMPRILERFQQFLGVLPERYPHMFTAEQLRGLINIEQAEFAGLGQAVIARSLASIPGILTVMVYLILIPLLVFFLLKDRQQILNWLGRFLPAERPLLRRIWTEMNEQFANYARGKVLEVLIVGSLTYFAFIWLAMDYAALLGLLVGLSVIVPYIGVTLVTLPIVMVGFFQWGLTIEFYSMFGVYLVIQILDGIVLVPLLFSEAVNLHPVAIIMAVLFFGGIWGVWGVFFAIPLATLVKAIINAWPTAEPVAPQAMSQT